MKSLRGWISSWVWMLLESLQGLPAMENGALEFRGANSAVNTPPTSMTRRNNGTSPCKTKDKAFNASFDCVRWTVEWNWVTSLPLLKIKVVCYETRLRAKFDREIECWIEGGNLFHIGGRRDDGSVIINASGPTRKEQSPVSPGLSRAE